MSYARFAEESDVYVFFSCAGVFECCACQLGGPFTVTTRTAAEMIEHLREHVAKGQKVPDYTFAGLAEES